MGSGDVRQHPPAAAAGVQGAAAAEAGEDRGIETTTGALPQGVSIPIQPEPAQVSQDGLLGAAAVARGVEIIDAEQPFPTPQTGLQPAQQGGTEVAAMQGAAGGWGEATAISLAAAPDSFLQKLFHMPWQGRS